MGNNTMKTASSWGRKVGTLAALICVVAAFVGCDGPDAVGADHEVEGVTTDSAHVLIQEFPRETLEVLAPFQLAPQPSVRIGVLEGASEYQWTRPVAGTRLSDGSIAVLEQAPAEVRLFDDSGQFIRRIGAEGAGPGEFNSPLGLAALPGDTLLVWDRGSRRLTWFSLDGTMELERGLGELGSIQTLRQVVLAPDGTAVLLGATTTMEDLANQGRVRESWLVVPLKPDGEPGPALGTVPGTERAIAMERSDSGEVMSISVQGRWWWGEGFAWASKTGVWTADQMVLETRHFDVERGLDRIVRISAPDRPFTRALIDSLHRVELDRVPDPDVRELWRSDFEAREYPPDVPPVAAVFADEANRVWMGLTEPPPERLPSRELPAVRRWVLFEGSSAEGSSAGTGATGSSADGEALQLLGILTLPPRSHPLWADADGALLVRNDEEFDVPYIEWYPYVLSP